jgi:hypothetical protein
MKKRPGMNVPGRFAVLNATGTFGRFAQNLKKIELKIYKKIMKQAPGACFTKIRI